MVKNDEAISPVFGTLLLVLLTTVFALIIGAFVFGMATGMPSPKLVAATVQQVDGTHITSTYHGGQSAKTCVGVKWVITTIGGSNMTYTMGNLDPSSDQLEVGTEHTFVGSFQGNNHVIAIAYFTDEAQQVVLDTNI